MPEFLRCRHQTIVDSPGIQCQIDIPDTGVGWELLKLRGDTFQGSFFCLSRAEGVGSIGVQARLEVNDDSARLTILNPVLAARNP